MTASIITARYTYNCLVADNPTKNPATLGEMLRLSRWASDLTEAEFARVETGIFERQIPAGQFVCRKGEPCDHWFGVIDGLLKLSSDLVTGKTATLTGVPPGGWFGEGSMLKTEPRRYDGIALRHSRVAFMRRETFQWLLDHSIVFNRFLLVQLNERLGQFIGMIESERLYDIDKRVAHCLAVLFHPVLYPGLDDRLAISQEEIGHLAGISRQRTNQSLKVLEEAGFLAIEYGGVRILDLDGLRTFGF